METLHWGWEARPVYGKLRGKPSTALPWSHPGSYSGFIHKESSSHLSRRQMAQNRSSLLVLFTVEVTEAQTELVNEKQVSKTILSITPSCLCEEHKSIQ